MFTFKSSAVLSPIIILCFFFTYFTIYSSNLSPATFSEVLELFLQKGNKKKSVFSQEESKVENLFSKNSPHQDDTL